MRTLFFLGFVLLCFLLVAFCYELKNSSRETLSPCGIGREVNMHPKPCVEGFYSSGASLRDKPYVEEDTQQTIDTADFGRREGEFYLRRRY